jgi:hypothetical protein
MIDHAGVKVSAALACGGRDGAFVLDPDGHNVEAVCHEASGARGATR